MNYKIRSWLTFSEEILANETGQAADGAPLRKLAVVCVLENPYAGRFSQDLPLLVKDSPQLGRDFGRRLVALSNNEKISSCGKACIVGVDGEYEHGNALLTTAFADPVREPGSHWVRPELVAQVGFTEWTPTGRLRHPRFQGLRIDKPARDVVRERPS